MHEGFQGTVGFCCGMWVFFDEGCLSLFVSGCSLPTLLLLNQRVGWDGVGGVLQLPSLIINFNPKLLLERNLDYICSELAGIKW